MIGAANLCAVPRRRGQPWFRVATRSGELDLGQAVDLNPITQKFTITNAVGESLGIGSINCGAAWCSVSGVPATIGGGDSASVSVTVTPSLLTSAFFRTTVDINSSGGKASVPITLLLAQAPTMVLAPSGIQFTAPAG
jgi:hypothetical protein